MKNQVDSKLTGLLIRTEHQMATRKRRAENAASTEDGPNNADFDSSVPLDAEEHLLKIPESHRALISLTGKGFERALLSKLDWMTYLYVFFPALHDSLIWNLPHKRHTCNHFKHNKVHALAVHFF